MIYVHFKNKYCLAVIPMVLFLVVFIFGNWQQMNRLLAQSASYEVGMIDSMDKVFIKNDLQSFQGKWTTVWNLALAQNEYESFQVVVKANKDLIGVRVTLLDSNGLQIEAYPVGSLEIKQPSHSHSGNLGWYPDPILTFADKIDVRNGDYQSFWVTIYAPKGVPAGLRPIKLRISGDNTEPADITVNIKVWNFTLPDKPSLSTALSWDGRDIESIYKDTLSWPKRENAQRHILYEEEMKYLIEKYRFWLDNIYGQGQAYQNELYNNDYGFIDKSQLHCGPMHLTEDCSKITYSMFPEGVSDPASFDDYINTYVAEVKEQWNSISAQKRPYYYLYMLDEIPPQCYEQSKYIVQKIHEALPDIPILIASYGDEIPAKSDAQFLSWLMGVAGANPDTWQGDYIRAQRKEVWPYTTGWNPTTITWYLEDPLINTRILLGASAYKFKFDGFLYWRVGNWNAESNKRPISITNGAYISWDPWNEFGNGISSLFWPGPERIIPSVRLANFRDGMEDYEYYKIAECLTDSRIGVSQSIVGDQLQNRTGDPNTYYAERERIANLIESQGGNGSRCRGPFSTAFNNPSPPPQTKKGDLNSDNKVDVIDLGIFLSNWGSASKPSADLNQDGRVDVIDLGIFLSNWG